jgi:signal transduction histidine kinase
LELDLPASRKQELWQDAVRGRWPLSAEQLDYYAPLLGGTAPGPYAEHLRFARDLEDRFRHHGFLRPDEVHPFAFAANGAEYQIFFRLQAVDQTRILGFAVDSDWLRAQLPSGTTLIPKTSCARDGAVRASFSALFPFWDLALPAPAASSASSGLALQAATTALVLCLLLMGVILLLRDLSRDARLNQVRSDFVGAVSHELKTPVTVIRLYGETLLEDDNFSPAERRGFYEIITRESDRLTQLIDKVLAFSKIDRGEKQYHLQPGDLAPVVERTVETYRQYLQRRGYAVETELAAELPPVRIDADAVSQALVNLLDNAAKYSGENKSIAVRTYASNGCAVLEVEDHGIGIPRDQQEKIFERFYRVGNAVAKGGYGLGLYLVRHTMEAHSGKVELESEPQQGSRFRLIFPEAS